MMIETTPDERDVLSVLFRTNRLPTRPTPCSRWPAEPRKPKQEIPVLHIAAGQLTSRLLPWDDQVPYAPAIKPIGMRAALVPTRRFSLDNGRTWQGHQSSEWFLVAACLIPYHRIYSADYKAVAILRSAKGNPVVIPAEGAMDWLTPNRDTRHMQEAEADFIAMERGIHQPLIQEETQSIR